MKTNAQLQDDANHMLDGLIDAYQRDSAHPNNALKPDYQRSFEVAKVMLNLTKVRPECMTWVLCCAVQRLVDRAIISETETEMKGQTDA